MHPLRDSKDLQDCWPFQREVEGTLSFHKYFSCPSFVRMCLVWVSKLERRRVDGSLPARWLEATVLFYIYATCTSTNLLYITMVRKPLPHAALGTKGYGSRFVVRSFVHSVHCATESSAHFFAPVKVRTG